MIKKILLKPIILSILIGVVLIIMNRQGWLERPKYYFFSLTEPIQEKFYKSSWHINDFLSFLASINHLRSENDQLKQENQRLIGETARLSGKDRENELLRQQLNLLGSSETKLAMADVIGQDLSNSGRYLLINKGAKDGIKEKMAVVAAGNILVGQIIKADYITAKIRLITDINSRINALIQESEITGLVQGGSNGLVIDLMPQGKNIGIDNKIVTSGLAGVFPPGLFIGCVQKVISTNVDVFQKAEIKSNVDFKSIDKVFIIQE